MRLFSSVSKKPKQEGQPWLQTCSELSRSSPGFSSCLVKNGTDLKKMKEPASGMAKHGVRGQVGVRGQQQPRSGAFDDGNGHCVRCAAVASRSFYASFHVLGGEHARASKNSTETETYFQDSHQLLTEISDGISRPHAQRQQPVIPATPHGPFGEGFAMDVPSAVGTSARPCKCGDIFCQS